MNLLPAMLNRKSWIHSLTLLVALSLLTSCTYVDPKYQQLLPLAEKTPDPEAVVGMWHRKSPDYIGLGTIHIAYLFKRDGTGLATYHMRETEQNPPFTWKYKSGGVWKCQFENGALVELQLSQGKLLRRGGGVSDVLEKNPLE